METGLNVEVSPYGIAKDFFTMKHKNYVVAFIKHSASYQEIMKLKQIPCVIDGKKIFAIVRELKKANKEMIGVKPLLGTIGKGGHAVCITGMEGTNIEMIDSQAKRGYILRPARSVDPTMYYII
jgi:acetoacetate decarboxylase